MNKFLCLSAAAILAMATAASAQDRGRDDAHHGGRRGAPPAAARGPAAPPPGRGAPAANAPAANHGTGTYTFGHNGSRPSSDRPSSAHSAPSANHGNHAAPTRGRAQPNYSQYHRAFNAPRRFHYRGPSYRRPSGWYSRRWTFGDILPSLFWSSGYWINDYGGYGLMAPPPGTVWVRDGDDAILIDRFSGEVIQVEYGIFY